jgi:hypothetical protein
MGSNHQQADRFITILEGIDEQAILGSHLAHGLQHEHRTHQQSMVGQLAQTLIEYADATHDLRNEDAVNMCRDIKALLIDKQWAYETTATEPQPIMRLNYI